MTDQQHTATAHRFADPRLAEIAATADLIDGRLDGSDDGGGGGDQGGDQGSGDQGGTGDGGDQGGKSGGDTSSSNGDQGGDRNGGDQGGEGVEKWKGHARTWETRAGEHKTAREAAEAELAQYKEREKAARKAYGLDPDDDEDPAKVAERTATERDEHKTAREKAEADLKLERRERKAEGFARKHGGDVDAVMDSRRVVKGLAELGDDASDEDLEKVITDALEANSRLKATGGTTTPPTTPPAGSGEQDSAAGTKSGTSDIDDAIKARRERRKG